MPVDTLKSNIRAVIDWPKKGIIFRDITPVLEDKELFHQLIDELARLVPSRPIDKIVGIDARGFILASALAYKLGTGLAVARKKGKLPPKTISRSYALEYASASLEMREGSIKAGENILLCDDLLATGGTMKAAADLVRHLGGTVAGIIFFIALTDLKGLEKLREYNVSYLIDF